MQRSGVDRGEDSSVWIYSRRLRHPNVILFLGACTKPPRLSMVTEYMEMGSLYYLIHLSGQKKKLSWRRRLKMLRDICSLGVIMWEPCTLSRPWYGTAPERVVYAVANEGSRLEIPEGPLGRLIADCWAEPQDRPSCEDILTCLPEYKYSLR